MSINWFLTRQVCFLYLSNFVINKCICFGFKAETTFFSVNYISWVVTPATFFYQRMREIIKIFFRSEQMKCVHYKFFQDISHTLDMSHAVEVHGLFLEFLVIYL